MIVHNVFFTLNDPSFENISTLISSCNQWLPKHDGILFFAAGSLCKELNRDVNDFDFHVALNIVFSNLCSHDAYQVSANHKTFIEQNKESWKKVRVFDSVVNKD